MNSIYALADATVNELALIAHLLVIGARNAAWVAEEPSVRWACSPVVDLEHIRFMGYDSIERYNRIQKECEYWDVYKSAHGIRPRWINFAEFSDAELDAMLDSVYDDLRAENERQDAEEARERQIAADLTARFGYTYEQLVQMGVVGERDYSEEYAEDCRKWQEQDEERAASDLEDYYLQLELAC